MKITLIRHFKVDFEWAAAYDSEGYEKACEYYDTSNVILSDKEIKAEGVIISSTMDRALETTKHIFKRHPDITTDLLREVPIRPFMKTNKILPTLLWTSVGRIQWLLNSKKQPETYAESKLRVYRILDQLIAKNEDCTIVAHGLVIKLILNRLKKEKFRGFYPTLIENAVPYEFIN